MGLEFLIFHQSFFSYAYSFFFLLYAPFLVFNLDKLEVVHPHTAAMGKLKEDNQVVEDIPKGGSQAVGDIQAEEDIHVVDNQPEGDSLATVVGIHSLVGVDSLVTVVGIQGTVSIHKVVALALAVVLPSSTLQATAWHSRVTQQFGFAQVIQSSSLLQVVREDPLAFLLVLLHLAPS